MDIPQGMQAMAQTENQTNRMTDNIATYILNPPGWLSENVVYEMCSKLISIKIYLKGKLYKIHPGFLGAIQK